MFHEGDLQSGIALAVQQSKGVFCFVHDDTETSQKWEDILQDEEIKPDVLSQTVLLKMKAGSQEAGFLNGICPITSTPALVLIRDARLQENIQNKDLNLEELKSRLKSIFAPVETESGADPIASPSSATTLGYLDLKSSTGRMRLPNNAYDALRSQTESMLKNNIRPSFIFKRQLQLLDNIDFLKDVVKRLREDETDSQPTLPDEICDRLLRTPAHSLQPANSRTGTASTNQSPSSNAPATQSSTSPAVNVPSSMSLTPPPQTEAAHGNDANAQTQSNRHQSQRADYIKMQKEREQKQKDERERIKAQIKADRDERRRREEVRKQGEIMNESSGSSTPKPRSTEIRVQVRVFDGSTIRQTFAPSATLSNDVREWVGSASSVDVPYNLKLILTPQPNRNIEAAEEELPLSDLGIRGSCTFVMVPVKGYVESYSGSTAGGLLGSAVSGGYNLVSGTAGALFGGVKSILGYSQPQSPNATPGNSGNTAPTTSSNPARVRTLADQRAEAAKRDQQFYNGNQLNFEPRKDDDETRKND